MAQQHHHAADQGGGYVVRRPRVTDAVGEALRASFTLPCLPADMRAALLKLDASDCA